MSREMRESRVNELHSMRLRGMMEDGKHKKGKIVVVVMELRRARVSGGGRTLIEPARKSNEPAQATNRRPRHGDLVR